MVLGGDRTNAAQAARLLQGASLASRQREALPQHGGNSTDGAFPLGPADVQGTELLSAVPPPPSPEQSWCWSRVALPSCMPALWVVAVHGEGIQLRLSLVCGALRLRSG